MSVLSKMEVKEFRVARRTQINATLAAVAIPLVLAAAAILLVMVRKEAAFLYEIPGNNYKINAVLIAFMVAAHLIVLVSLWLYNKDIIKGASLTKARTEERSHVATLAAQLLIVTCAIEVIGIGFVILALCGVEIVTFSNIVQGNVLLTVIIFAMFLRVDLLMMKCSRIDRDFHLAETKNSRVARIKGGIATAKADALRAENTYNLSLMSVILIDIPTLGITALSWLVLLAVERASVFREVREGTGTEIDWALFFFGADTGVVVALLIFSQIVFATLKLRYEFNDFRIGLYGQDASLI